MAHVVLLHGWGMNQGIWQLQKEALAASSCHSFTTLNLPGFGGSEFNGQDYTLDALATQLAGQIPAQSIVVAWSLSGLVALKLAQQHPEKISKLIFVASSPLFSSAEGWPGIELQVLDNFMTQLSKNHQKTVERFLAIQAMGSDHAKQDIKQIKQLLAQYPSASEIALAGGLEILKNDDLRALFAQTKIPMSGIFGRLDSLVPVTAIEKMKALNSMFQVDILPKASHAPFISHPEEFANLLLSQIEA